MAADTPNNTLRIIRILQAFVPDNAPQTSAALHRLSGTSRSTFHGLLREMCRAGWLERCDHGTYRLGPKAAALAYLSVRAAPPRVSAPRPVVFQYEADKAGECRRRRPSPQQGWGCSTPGTPVSRSVLFNSALATRPAETSQPKVSRYHCEEHREAARPPRGAAGPCPT